MKIEAGTLISPACGSMCFIKPCRNLRQKHSRFTEIFQHRPVHLLSDAFLAAAGIDRIV